MKFTRITDRQVREALDLAADPDVSAVQREEDMRSERDEIDRLIEQVDRELVAEQHIEGRRLTHAFTDQRSARRASRRAGRSALRSLPVRLSPSELDESEAA
jgi:hypothetical protein